MADFSGIGVLISAIFIVNIIRKAKAGKDGISSAFSSSNQRRQALIPDALVRAIQKKDVDKIYRLFFEDKNINVQKVYNTGETALMIAVKTGDATIVKMLLDKGAYVQVKDNQGNSPLSLAQKLGHKDIESFLNGAVKKRLRLIEAKKNYE